MAWTYGGRGSPTAGSFQSSVTGTMLLSAENLYGATSGVLIAIVQVKNNDTITTATSGWTKLLQDNNGAAQTQAIFIAAWGAAAPVFSWSNAAACRASVVLYFDPMNSMVTNAIGASSLTVGSGTTHTSTSITSTRVGSMFLYIETRAASSTLTEPATWVEDTDSASAIDAGGTTVGSKNAGASGSASGAISVTASVTSAWMQRQIELLIAAPGAGVSVSETVLSSQIVPAGGVSAREVALSALLMPGTEPVVTTARRRIVNCT